MDEPTDSSSYSVIGSKVASLKIETRFSHRAVDDGGMLAGWWRRESSLKALTSAIVGPDGRDSHHLRLGISNPDLIPAFDKPNMRFQSAK